jgi:hypothetical protein
MLMSPYDFSEATPGAVAQSCAAKPTGSDEAGSEWTSVLYFQESQPDQLSPFNGAIASYAFEFRRAHQATRFGE